MNVLIADDEVEIAEIYDFLIRDKFPEKVETFIVNSGNAAIEILKTHKIDFCISDHNMPNGNGNEILKYIIANNLSVSFILSSTVAPKEMPDAYPLDRVFFHIQKPEIIEGVKKLAAFIKEQNPIKPAVQTVEDGYIPVSLEFLLMLEKTPSNLYIRISDTKYLKCFNGDVPFTIEDNAKYLSKSVTKLYVKKPTDQVAITKLITASINKLMSKKNIPLNEKMATVHTQLCDLIKFTGMSEELAAATKENINQSVAIIMKNPQLNDLWKNFAVKGEYPSQLYSLHSMLSSVITKKLSWSSEATLFKLTLAAFLQDVTLETLPVMKIFDNHHFEEIKDTLTRDEVKNFLEHPMKAKDLVLTFKEIPPDIDKLILEQHEMPDGSGFPRKLSANQLGPMSCLFILCGLLARFILQEGSNFQMKNFVDKFEPLGYSKGNFKESFNIIKSM